MNRGNKLWEGHRLLLPELREKVTSTCQRCLFLVKIAGRAESRPGCLVSIKEYSTLQKKVPREIQAINLLLQVGKDGLKEILEMGSNPDSMSCGLYRPKPDHL